MLRWHQAHGQNVSLTCRHFAASRPTFYRWQDRYRRSGLPGLEDRSQRPHRVRHPSWSLVEIQAVLALREAYPRWGKAKLQVLAAQQGHDLSVSMVGRILALLRQSGQLREGRRKGVRTVSRPRPFAIR